MKTLKPILLVLILGLLLNSCVVKSLFPFYTVNSIYFEKKFIGDWEDDDKGKWEVLSLEDFFLKENEQKNPSELDKENIEAYQKYKNGYIVHFEKDSTKTSFLAMPFKINNQLFLDFTPIEDKESDESKNMLYKMHLIGVHTFAKFEITDANEANIKWFSSEKLGRLLKENKIKIKHEKVGVMETTLLTASSEELEKFIKKYMDSKDQNKWETDVEANLKRIHEN